MSKKIDLTKLKSPSQAAATKPAGVGVLSITNTNKHGRRITLSDELMEQLGYPEALQVGFVKKRLAIGESLPNTDISFYPKQTGSGRKHYVYASTLVQEITDFYDLDFSDKTSITFHKVKYVDGDDGFTVALVSMRE